MYYSISEVSKQLKVSKVTIYKKIDKINELKGCVKQLKDGKYISAEGIEIIKKSLQLTQFIKPLQDELKEDDGKQDFTRELTIYKQLIESLENQVKDLKEDRTKLYDQLVIKDKQIDSLTDTLNASQKLVENSQVLLKQEQDRSKLLIETAEAHKERGFWSMFRRKNAT